MSDESVEDSIHDRYALRKFAGIDFMTEQVPDAATLLHFRHLMEESKLGRVMLEGTKRLMDETGHIIYDGTIVDATIISEPTSTKNKEHVRDPKSTKQKRVTNGASA